MTVDINVSIDATYNSFQANYKLHHDKNTIDLALIERFLSMMPKKWDDAIRERTSTMANPTFLQVFQVAIRKYGDTTPSSRKENLDSMLNKWHPDDGIETLWMQIKEAAQFASYAGQPLNDTQMADIALICIACTGAYKQAYLDFKHEADQSCINLVNFFDERKKDQREVEVEAAEHGYGMNANEDVNDDVTRNFTKSLTNLANQMSTNEQRYGQQQHQQQQPQQHNGNANMMQMHANMAALQQQVAMLTMSNQCPPIQPMMMAMPQMQHMVLQQQ